MNLTFYDEKTAIELESYDEMTSINCIELFNIKRKIEKEYDTKCIFVINNKKKSVMC